MKIGNKIFDTENESYIMGILNVTPDSFYDGGRNNFFDNAIKRAEEMVAEGATIIDIGGESTRPGAAYVSEQEELERVMPVIEKLVKTIDVPISLDTYKANVAAEGIKAGVALVNDIWGLKKDPDMINVLADSDVAYCLMHNDEKMCDTKTVVDEVMEDLKKSLDKAVSAGIAKERIMLDPGVGFAKDTEGNLKILKDLARFNELGCPVLLGCSRKSVIGNTLNIPADERLSGTLATTAYAVMAKTAFIRVHDVRENMEVVKMMKAMLDA